MSKEISLFNDEVIVDVYSTLGSWCGSFVCGKKTYKELEKYNKTNKGSNYFWKRKNQRSIRTMKSIKEKIKLYDHLYKQADRLIKKYDPCKFENGKCSRSYGGCCKPCKYLGSNGCKVKSLACKLWLCDEAKEKYPKLWDKLKNIRQVALDNGLYVIRGSKKDVIRHLKQTELEEAYRTGKLSGKEYHAKLKETKVLSTPAKR